MSSLGPYKEAGTAIVCGVEYRVVEGKRLQSKTEPIRGAVNSYFNTITLDQTLGKSQKELTFLHELVHAVDDALNVDLVEDQVRLLGAGLYSLQFKGPKKRDRVRTMRGVFYG